MADTRPHLHQQAAGGCARVDELVLEGVRVDGLFVSTFHAFCARQIGTHAEQVGLDPGFSNLTPRTSARR